MRPSAIHTYENFLKYFNFFIWQTIKKCQLFSGTLGIGHQPNIILKVSMSIAFTSCFYTELLYFPLGSVLKTAIFLYLFALIHEMYLISLPIN